MWIDEFVSLLKKSTIEMPRLPEAFAIKDANLPKHLYKYRCVDEKGYSLCNLRDNTVWICSPEAYNDPYDCLLRVSEIDVVTAAKRGQVADFVRLFKLDDVLPPEAIEQALTTSDPFEHLAAAIPADHVFPDGAHPIRMAQFESMMWNRHVPDLIRFVRQVRDASKVCSFSERNDSIVMWSHYADHHKGFCIEHDISSLPAKCLLRRDVYPVMYSPDLLDLTHWFEQLFRGQKDSFNPAMVRLALLHKYTDWSYEKEWRYLFTEPRLSPDRAMQVPTPSRVFLGARMGDDKKAEVTAICTGKGIEVWQMELAPDAFNLRSFRVE